MLSIVRFPLWIALLLLSFFAIPTWAANEADVRQAWQLLDYIAVDYSAAVADGEVVDEGEYAEMQEFSATIRERLQRLAQNLPETTLLTDADHLQSLIASHASAERVAEAAHALADELLATFGVVAVPMQTPDLVAGKRLYAEQCASCHGANGDGNGPAAEGMEPPPIAFTDAERANQRSPLALYEAITQGLDGTAMLSYAHLSEADRWALAFFVGTLAYDAGQATAGQAVWEGKTAASAIPSLESLSRSSQKQLAQTLDAGQATAITAYLRQHPEVLTEQTVEVAGSLALAREQLDASLKAYAKGDATNAQRLALSSYLDGVEPVEPMLAVRDRALLREVESAMMALRGSLRAGAPLETVRSNADRLYTLFDQAEAVLSTTGGSQLAAFFGSFTILVREGLEALLIVVGMIAFLRRAKRPDALRWVHAGWTGALLAGLLTWAAATWLITISGAQRELTEGFSSLFAALVLLSVGIWMHQKSAAGRWQQYLNKHLSAALTRRSAWFLFILSFVAVYREVFETILFYVAMWNPDDRLAIVGGMVAGIVLLAVVAIALLRLGMRLPIGKFFSISSIFIAVLAVVLVGKGVMALQEAGWIEQTRAALAPHIDLLGIYPTWQSLLAQMAVAIAAVVGFMMNTRTGGAAASR